jgi:hypothetical protein
MGVLAEMIRNLLAIRYRQISRLVFRHRADVPPSARWHSRGEAPIPPSIGPSRRKACGGDPYPSHDLTQPAARHKSYPKRLRKILRFWPGGMTEPRDRLRLDLPDALARDAQLVAHLFQRAGFAACQTIAQLQDVHFTR